MTYMLLLNCALKLVEEIILCKGTVIDVMLYTMNTHGRVEIWHPILSWHSTSNLVTMLVSMLFHTHYSLTIPHYMLYSLS